MLRISILHEMCGVHFMPPLRTAFLGYVFRKAGLLIAPLVYGLKKKNG